LNQPPGASEAHYDTLNIRAWERIDPDWLPVPTYLIKRVHGNKLVQDCGKGLTPAQARASALFESIERHAAETLEGRPLTSGCYNDLRRDNALNVLPPTLFVPLPPMAQEKRLNWIRGFDLLNQEHVLLPADFAFFPYESGLTAVNTVGLAANTTQLAAVRNALYEVIEQDVLGISVYNGLPGIDIILSSEDGAVHDVYQSILRAGIAVSLKLLESDLHVPVMLALFHHIPRSPGLTAAGVGCHLNPWVAAARALTECSQSASFWHYMKNHNPQPEGPVIRPELRFTVRYTSTSPSLKLSDIPNQSHGNSLYDVLDLLGRLRQTTSKVVVVDLTADNIGLPVVRVLIPGFEVALMDGSSPPRGRAVTFEKAISKYMRVKESGAPL